MDLEIIKQSSTKIFARSSGPGGQNVNKTSTKVILHFHIDHSSLKPNEKEHLWKLFPSGIIQVINQETRSQSQNLKLAYLKLQSIIEKNLKKRKKRKKTIAPHLTPKGKKLKAAQDKLLKYRERYLKI